MFEIFAPHGVDVYKVGHPYMLPESLLELYGNMTARSDRFAKVLPDFDHKVVFCGLQAVAEYLLVKCWNDTFFRQPKDKVVKRYKRRMDSMLEKNVVPVYKMAALHDLGYLPLLIKALPEGSRVDIRCPLFTVRSTHPDFAWVEQYIETQLSAELWKVITNASHAYEFRRLFTKYAISTGVDISFVDYQGHNFADRGMSGLHDAATSGLGHLMVFKGTDSVLSVDAAEDFYAEADGTLDGVVVGKSIVATEHAVAGVNIAVIARELDRTGEWNGWSKRELNPRKTIGPWAGESMWAESAPTLELAEVAFIKYLLTVKYPTGNFSYVSDTYDFWAVVTYIADHLKDDIMARTGKVVFRPDSGDPVKIMVGDPGARRDSPEFMGAAACLVTTFRGMATSTGHLQLDTHVGLIYGDAITLDRADAILEGWYVKGFASNCGVFGIGSFSYQFVTRDSFGQAMKATHATAAFEEYEIFKAPKTDDGTKWSARGFIRVERENGHYVPYDRQTREQEALGALETVFFNSQMLRHQTLTEVRNRLLSEAV